MASLKELAVRRGEMFFFDPRYITVDPDYNVRMDGPELRAANEELRESIRREGFKASHPLTVRLDGEKLIVVAGHRRLAQVLALIEEGMDILAIPCVAEAKGTSVEDRDFDLITSNSGLPLPPVERGIMFKRRLAAGMSVDAIAKRAGISTKHVHNLLTLAGAPQEVKEMIAQGELSSTTAIQTLKAEGETKGTATLVAAVADAKAAGKAKATTKTMAAASPTKVKPAPGQSYLDSILAMDGVTAPEAEAAPEPALTTQSRHGFARPRMTPQKFQEMWTVMCECTVVDDAKIIHCMIKDCLN